MVPLRVDSKETEDTGPSDLLVPSEVPEWGLIPASDGDGESNAISAAAVPSIVDFSGAMTPMGR